METNLYLCHLKQEIDNKLKKTADVYKNVFYNKLYPLILKKCKEDKDRLKNSLKVAFESDPLFYLNMVYALRHPEKVMNGNGNHKFIPVVNSEFYDTVNESSDDYNELVEGGALENGIRALEGS